MSKTYEIQLDHLSQSAMVCDFIQGQWLITDVNTTLATSRGLMKSLMIDQSLADIFPLLYKSHGPHLAEALAKGKQTLVQGVLLIPQGDSRLLFLADDLCRDAAYSALPSRQIEEWDMFAKAADHADFLMRIIDLKGIILFVNRAFCHKTGYTKTELIGSRTNIIKSGAQDDAFYQRLWKTLDAGEVFKDTFVNRKKNGDLYFEEETIVPVKNALGRVEFFLVTGKDISRRLALQEKITLSENNFRNVFDNSSDGMVILDMQGYILYVNQVKLKRLGYRMDELIGQHVSILDSPEEIAMIPQRMAQLVEKGSILFDSAHMTKSGEIMPIEVHASLVVYNNQPAILSVIRDIRHRKLMEDQLRYAEERYHTIFDLASLGLVLVDPETQMAVEFNRTAAEQLGYSPEEFAKLRIADYEAVQKDDYINENIEEILINKVKTFQTQHRHKLGHILDVMVSVQMIELQGKPYIVAIFQDISQIKKYQRELQTLSLRLSLATRAAAIGVWDWDLQNQTMHWDEQMYRIYDQPSAIAEDQVLDFWRSNMQEEERQRVENALQQAILHGGVFNQQFSIHTPLGNHKYIQAMAMVSYDTQGQPQRVTGVNWDITRQKTNEKRLEGYVYTDSLTQIPNRRHFENALLQEWNRAQRSLGVLSLCMVDIDYFKNYNDAYGHVAGDQCLYEVAQTMHNLVGRAGELVARYGGEEFVILLPASNSEAAQKIAQKVVKEVCNLHIPHEKSEVADHITLSIGVATIDFKKPTYSLAQELIQGADENLYKAKSLGRNRVIVDGQDAGQHVTPICPLSQ